MMKTHLLLLAIALVGLGALAGCDGYGKPPTPPEQTENPPARTERGAPQGER